MGLEAKHVFFRYHERQSWILKDCTLRVEKGERLAILAPSGYGKTTLALLLAGYFSPEKGEILLESQRLLEKGLCPVQMIHQHPENAINPRWKLRQVLEEAGRPEEELLDVLGIERAWLNRYPGELSGGELQRFCTARALMSRPDYLVCDEISTMLDAITQAQIWQIILKESVERNMGMVIITHNKHLADRIADRLIELSE